MSLLKDLVGAVAPTLGSALGVPLLAGKAVRALSRAVLGKEDGTEEELLTAIQDPEKAAAARLALLQAELGYQLEAMRAEVEAMKAVNATMQAEAASDHWPTYSWRPFIGYCFGVTFVGCFLALPLLKIAVPVIPEWAWMSITAVLGVASFWRGKMQADPRVPTDNRG